MKKILFSIFGFFLVISCFAQKDSLVTNKDRKKRDVLLQTNFGDIIIRLSDSTPLHLDNFLKLVKTHYYDSVLFHRVIKNFMIQAGDPDSKKAAPGKPLGHPAEPARKACRLYQEGSARRRCIACASSRQDGTRNERRMERQSMPAANRFVR